MKLYRTGFIVGKFAPLHKGHEYLILTAMEQCENLVILSYTSEDYGRYSNPENRRKWLTEFVSQHSDMCNVTIAIPQPGAYIPRDGDVDSVHRSFCADYLFYNLNTSVQAVFSSEEYGAGLSEYLSRYFSEKFCVEFPVVNICVDLERRAYPISASMVRNMYLNRACRFGIISQYVMSLLTPRVLILGGESSGKTTLARALSSRLSVSWVPEFGREYYKNKNGKLFFEDMEHIAKTQLAHEDLTAMNMNSNGLIICDTSPLTTAFYSMEMFGHVSENLDKMARQTLTDYDAIYLCHSDIPFYQDGTRRDSKFRDKGYNFYLTQAGSKVTIVSGTVSERVDFVVKDLKSRDLV